MTAEHTVCSSFMVPIGLGALPAGIFNFRICLRIICPTSLRPGHWYGRETTKPWHFFMIRYRMFYRSSFVQPLCRRMDWNLSYRIFRPLKPASFPGWLKRHGALMSLPRTGISIVRRPVRCLASRSWNMGLMGICARKGKSPNWPLAMVAQSVLWKRLIIMQWRK